MTDKPQAPAGQPISQNDLGLVLFRQPWEPPNLVLAISSEWPREPGVWWTPTGPGEGTARHTNPNTADMTSRHGVPYEARNLGPENVLQIVTFDLKTPGRDTMSGNGLGKPTTPRKNLQELGRPFKSFALRRPVDVPTRRLLLGPIHNGYCSTLTTGNPSRLGGGSTRRPARMSSISSCACCPNTRSAGGRRLKTFCTAPPFA